MSQNRKTDHLIEGKAPPLASAVTMGIEDVVVELEHEKTAIFLWRLLFQLRVAIAILAAGVVASIPAGLPIAGIILACGATLLYVKLVWPIALLRNLHVKKLVHVALTSQGIQRHTGHTGASTTMVFRYSDLKTVSVSQLPWYRRYLAPQNFQMLVVRTRTTRWRWIPLAVAHGIRVEDGLRLERLIREKIDMASPIDPIAVVEVPLGHEEGNERVNHDESKSGR